MKFYISDVHRLSDGKITLDGRCLEGTIAVGSSFAFRQKGQVEKSADGEFIGKTKYITLGQVHVLVTEIQCYGRSLGELSEGVTARLSVEIGNEKGVVKGDVLSN